MYRSCSAVITWNKPSNHRNIIHYPKVWTFRLNNSTTTHSEKGVVDIWLLFPGWSCLPPPPIPRYVLDPSCMQLASPDALKTQGKGNFSSLILWDDISVGKSVSWNDNQGMLSRDWFSYSVRLWVIKKLRKQRGENCNFSRSHISPQLTSDYTCFFLTQKCFCSQNLVYS